MTPRPAGSGDLFLGMETIQWAHRPPRRRIDRKNVEPGWSLPARSRSGSSLDLALQWRSLSAGDDLLGLRERSFGATVGFTLHPFFKNQWLVPRKYD